MQGTYKYCKYCKPEYWDSCYFSSKCPVAKDDFKDAAEFEARCMNNAIILAYIKGIETRTLFEYMPEIIKEARIRAEEAMDAHN